VLVQTPLPSSALEQFAASTHAVFAARAVATFSDVLDGDPLSLVRQVNPLLQASTGTKRMKGNFLTFTTKFGKEF
jgi:hypothetical protein